MGDRSAYRRQPSPSPQRMELKRPSLVNLKEHSHSDRMSHMGFRVEDCKRNHPRPPQQSPSVPLTYGHLYPFAMAQVLPIPSTCILRTADV